MIGEIVGTYQLQQKIGEGSLGEVFLGQHTQSGQKAAVKVLFPNFSKQGTALARYFAEVRSTNTFHNPGIATIYDCGTHTNGRAFVCMEFLAGQSLAAALADLSIGDAATVVEIGAQIAGVLGAVHGRRMVHRALKPDSVFLTAPMPRPSVKLLDFGIANFSQSVRQSQTGSLLGAPLYMSPEVGRGLNTVDPRADIYSLGCMLFELATGRPPFVREGAGELIVAHATETPPAAKDLEPALPPALDALLARMLRKNPAERPQSMIEVAAALRACMKPISAAAPVFAPTPGMGSATPVASTPLVAPPPLSLPPPVVAASVRRPTPAFAPAVPGPRTDSMSFSPPTAAVPPAEPAERGARRPEPTALLDPSNDEAVAAPEHHRHSSHNNLRPVQPTALLDPSDAPVVAAPMQRESSRHSVPVATPLPRKPSSRSVPVAVEPRKKRREATVWIIVAAALVCVVALVLVLVARRGPTPPAVRSPALPPRTHEQFHPPAEPSPPKTEETAVAPEPTASAHESDPAAEATHARKEPSGSATPSAPRHRSHATKPSESPSPSPKASEAAEVPPRLTPHGSPKW